MNESRSGSAAPPGRKSPKQGDFRPSRAIFVRILLLHQTQEHFRHYFVAKLNIVDREFILDCIRSVSRFI